MRSARRALLAAALAGMLPSAARAQSAPVQLAALAEPLKRDVPSPAATSAQSLCTANGAVGVPTDAQRRRARDLALRGKQAAVLGDRGSARDQLAEAAALDPTDADLAYQYARALEATGAAQEAARVYCRFLALAPSAPEAAEARERVAAFTPPPRSAISDEALASFRAALAAYDRRDLVAAEAALDTVTRLEPQWADPYYDRGLVRLARQHPSAAASDFEEYLRLKPEAADRAAVVARIDALRRSALSPSRALSLGLVFPGGGQFYTGRPTRGLLTLGAVSLAVGCAMQQRTTSTTVTTTATDPFGNPYPVQSTRYATDRPCLVPGLAAAALAAVSSAIDAYRYVSSR